MTCPSCRRPVAVARPRCLYCGAELPRELLEPAQGQAEPAAEPPPGPDRSLLILDLEGVEPSLVEGALGLSPFEAAQRARRGGFQLHRAVDAAEAAAEAGRLGNLGLRATIVPEAEVRTASRPLLVRGGRLEGTRLALRAEEAELRLRREDLLLLVRGPIARERQPTAKPGRVRVAVPEPGYRIHLHRHAEPRPLELDPAGFEFGDAPRVAESTLLQIGSWLEVLAAGVPIDDDFKRVPPALGPAKAEATGIAAAAGALAVREPRASGRGRLPLLLDNLAQFRFYSGWRAAVERRRAPGR